MFKAALRDDYYDDSIPAFKDFANNNLFLSYTTDLNAECWLDNIAEEWEYNYMNMLKLKL